MERSKQPHGLFKGRFIDSRSQRNSIRLPSIEEVLEDRDSYEPVVRYVDSKSAARAEQREWSFIRSMGKQPRVSKDQL